MTPPKGYRPCTAADLHEGVEVLVPMVIDGESGDAVTLLTDAGQCGVAWRSTLPGLALIRDDAAPDDDDLATALRERDEARADVAMLRATVTGLTERAGRANAEADRWASGFRVALGVGVVPFGEIADLAEAHAAKVRRMADSLAMRRTEPADSAAVADLRRDLRDANDDNLRASHRATTAEADLRATLLALGRMAVDLDRARGGGR